MKNSLLTLSSISHHYGKTGEIAHPVLKDISLTLYDGEIVALLGKSGSGKSTLLRIIAGLIPPSSGSVNFLGHPLKDALGMSMVFQTFALFPWLTVLENVKIGLESLDLSEAEICKRADAAVDLIGLNGYESAYPRELSGGMKQRVGFARAIVVNPELLLMDEPFSALDVLTAETLRGDFLALWESHKIPLKAVLMVTHNIEEAVLLSNRILILSSHPASLSQDIRVDLPYPRDRHGQDFQKIVDDIYVSMTSGTMKSDVLSPVRLQDRVIFAKLPDVSANKIAGLIVTLAAPPYRGRADVQDLSQSLQLDIQELLQIIEVLSILKFAEIEKGSMTLTEDGIVFSKADTQQRKKLFGKALLQHVPLVEYIQRTLQDRPFRNAPRSRFITILEDHLSKKEAISVLSTVIGWGRYTELFSYDDRRSLFMLEEETE